jgi:hypothetical protein
MSAITTDDSTCSARRDGLYSGLPDKLVRAANGIDYACRKIADRLFLFPRTVASRLHRSCPKLGATGHHQLRDLIDNATTPQARS